MGVTTVLSGCTLRLEHEDNSLPKLSQAQQLREDLVGIELALTASATDMAVAAGAQPPAQETTPAPAETSAPAGEQAQETDAPSAAPTQLPPPEQYPLTAPAGAVAASGFDAQALLGLVTRSQERLEALGGRWNPWAEGATPEPTYSPTPRAVPGTSAELMAVLEEALDKANELALISTADGQTSTAAVLSLSYAQEIAELSRHSGVPVTAKQLVESPRVATTHLPGSLSAGAGEDAAQESASPDSLSLFDPENPPLGLESINGLNYVRWSAETAGMASPEEERDPFLELSEELEKWLLDVQATSATENPESAAAVAFSVDRGETPTQWVLSALDQAIAPLLHDAVNAPSIDPHRRPTGAPRQAALVYAIRLSFTQVKLGSSPNSLPAK